MTTNMAILLDLDNIKPELREIEMICSQYGTIIERRAFSNTPAVLAAYGSKLRDLKYRFELTPSLSVVPQEVDNLIALTAQELINNPQLAIRLVAVVSNDNDFANLFLQLASQKIDTLAIGNNQLGQKLRERATYVELLKNILRPSYIGIDLGTTNTVIALANQTLTQQWAASAISVPVKNEREGLENTQLIPSSVRFAKLDSAEIGRHVRNQYYAFRDQTVLAWKHDLGTLKEGVPFEYELGIGLITPERAAAEVLKFCRDQLIKKHIDVGGAVITHPASYEPDAIEATRKAAKLAGWEEDDIVLLPEPKAALYDFLYRLRKGEIFANIDTSRLLNILVYDLGGGTLDISLHSVEWNSDISQFIIGDIAIGSRTRVGGDMVDEKIVDYLFEKYSKIKKLSEPSQKKLWYELRIYAEKFKQLWGAEYTSSKCEEEDFKLAFEILALDASFPIFYSFSNRHMQEALKDLLCPDIQPNFINQLDPITAFDRSPFTDRFNNFVVPVLEVLLKAKQRLKELPRVDAVLLNGGMTYFPLIRERLEKLLPNTLFLSEGDPDLAVARGAALFASGALKPSEGINPTNICLEVTDPNTGNSTLELLVAHGQKYPYRTTLQGFRLPIVKEGLIGFNAWVGMGSQPTQNTTLQRTRYVRAEEIQSANIQPGDHLNLEVEYTFDERLLLTLIHRDRQDARFRLEVSPQRTVKVSHPATISAPNQLANTVAQDLIPSIPRKRKGIEPDPSIQVQLMEWEKLAFSLSRNWHDAKVQTQRRQLENLSKQAANRLSIIQGLLQWLEQNGQPNAETRQTQQIIAVMSLSNIIQAISSDTQDFKSRDLEKRFHDWVLRQFQAGLSRFEFNNELHSATSLSPGKMLWSDFGESIYNQFSIISNKAFSVNLLNSFAICASGSARNLGRLQNIILSNGHMALRQKAAWALARLISPGQPPEWQVTNQDAEKVAFFILDQFKHSVSEPQVALDALGCLSQCIAWHIAGHPIDESIINDVLKLGKIYLPCQSNMQSYPQIAAQFDRKLELLERACDLSAATEEDIKDLKAWFLEIAKT